MLEPLNGANDNLDVSGPGSQNSTRGRTLRKWIEWALLLSGLSLVAGYATARLEEWVVSRVELSSLPGDDSPAVGSESGPELDAGSTEADIAGWAADRADAYKKSFTYQFGAPMAVLQIPKIHLAVPLLDGTDDLTLNHAVGRIKGTARPGEQGNIGIAGHRDGFFRGLKDVRLGDAIELRTVNGTSTYVVDQIRIVKPDNVGVLRPRPVDSLTLVTCYPFYFIGSVPQRYIVMASLTHETSSGSGSAVPDSDSPTNNTKKEKQ